jgi:hypothetical protein
MIQRCVLALMLAFSCTSTAFGQEPFGEPPELNWVERLQTVLGNPTLVYVLLLVGICGVTFEITMAKVSSTSPANSGAPAAGSPCKTAKPCGSSRDGLTLHVKPGP